MKWYKLLRRRHSSDRWCLLVILCMKSFLLKYSCSCHRTEKNEDPSSPFVTCSADFNQYCSCQVKWKDWNMIPPVDVHSSPPTSLHAAAHRVSVLRQWRHTFQAGFLLSVRGAYRKWLVRAQKSWESSASVELSVMWMRRRGAKAEDIYSAKELDVKMGERLKWVAQVTRGQAL